MDTFSSSKNDPVIHEGHKADSILPEGLISQSDAYFLTYLKISGLLYSGGSHLLTCFQVVKTITGVCMRRSPVPVYAGTFQQRKSYLQDHQKIETIQNAGVMKVHFFKDATLSLS